MNSMTPAERCDGHSVGVLVVDDDGRILIGDRADDAGAAPVTGHIYDAHTGPRAAAHAEVTEQMGLTVTELTYITSGWRANKCRRGDGPEGPGHCWYLYRAHTTGHLRPNPDSYQKVRWAEPTELRDLVARTLAHARGQMTVFDWVETPGIEPVWVLWLVMADAVPVDRQDLDLIEDFLTRGIPTPAVDNRSGRAS